MFELNLKKDDKEEPYLFHYSNDSTNEQIGSKIGSKRKRRDKFTEQDNKKRKITKQKHDSYKISNQNRLVEKFYPSNMAKEIYKKRPKEFVFNFLCHLFHCGQVEMSKKVKQSSPYKLVLEAYNPKSARIEEVKISDDDNNKQKLGKIRYIDIFGMYSKRKKERKASTSILNRGIRKLRKKFSKDIYNKT